MSTVKESIFEEVPLREGAFLLASWLPKGKAWGSAFNPNTNLGKLVAGLAVEYYRMGVMTNKIQSDFDVNTTIDLISEWEKSVGIPSECFSLSGSSLDERRASVKLLLSNFQGVQTLVDFKNVATIFGYTANIYPGKEIFIFPMSFPTHFMATTKEARFTIYVELDTGAPAAAFPLLFPCPFTTPPIAFFQCMYDLLAPANVQVLITTI